MLASKPMPKRADLVDYNHAVAGHAGTLCDPDGLLFIKPCTTKEVDFYQSAAAEHQDFFELMPLFMGTLMLNDATDIASINEQLPAVSEMLSEEIKDQVVMMAHQADTASHAQPSSSVSPAPPVSGSSSAPAKKDKNAWTPSQGKKIATDKAIVLENTAYGYKRPNILDVKLGVRLWADDAPEQKKQRFDKITSETTHGPLGFRIAGMRVYKGSENADELDGEDYKVYDKDYGRFHVNEGNVVDAFRRFMFNESAGVNEPFGQVVARAFVEELKNVQRVLEQEESRMYSASLLFVYEGDGEALQSAINETSASVTMSHKGKDEIISAGRSTARVDSGIGMDEDGKLIVSDDADADDSEDEEDLPHILSLKLIDFAHAQWTPGQGPDENILKGVRSLIRIFEELGGNEPEDV